MLPQRDGQVEVDAARCAPSLVEADLVVDDEIVALAGHHHVVVAVEPQLHRPAGLRRRPAAAMPAKRSAWRLLAAEAAAHAPHSTVTASNGRPSTCATTCWHFGRVLGRALDVHVAVLARHGERDLAFEIEMVLAAEAHAAGRRCGAPASAASASPRCMRLRRQHEARRARAPLRRQDWRGAPRSRSRPARGRARLVAGVSAATANSGWPTYSTMPCGEDRLVMRMTGDVVLAGNVGGGEHRDDAGRGAHRGEVEPTHPGMRLRAQRQRSLQRAGAVGQSSSRRASPVTCCAALSCGARAVVRRRP